MSAILMPFNQRSNLRRHVSMPCQVVSETAFELIGDQCVDLSPTGLQVKATRAARLSTPVLVSFRIPDSGIYVDAEGIVARVVWGRRDEDEYPSYGIEFTNIGRVDRAILAARLRGLPPPIPARNLRMDYASSVQSIALAA